MEKHLCSWAPFHLPKPTALHPNSYIRDVLTCRAFNTSRYHEPSPSKHIHSIPHNISIPLSIYHIANNMNHECMNMSYAFNSLNLILRSSNPVVHLLDSGLRVPKFARCHRKEKGERPGSFTSPLA